MITIFIILFLIPFWIFLRFWSKILHEYDLVLDSVADKTAMIYNYRSFSNWTWEQWHKNVKLMKILGSVFLIIFSIITIIVIIMSIIAEIQNGTVQIILFLGIICLVPLVKCISSSGRCFYIFYKVFFFGIDYVNENNKNIKKGHKLETKCIDFIKTLDIKRPYPNNKLLMDYEMRKLNYNWDVPFTGKFDMLVGYYAILSITILLSCISIISMAIIAFLMLLF